jgi:hypothetical protein
LNELRTIGNFTVGEGLPGFDITRKRIQQNRKSWLEEWNAKETKSSQSLENDHPPKEWKRHRRGIFHHSLASLKPINSGVKRVSQCPVRRTLKRLSPGN